LPNIFWNLNHELITFRFQFANGLRTSYGQNLSLTLIIINVLRFFKDIIYSRDIFLQLAILLSLPALFWYGIREKREEFVFLFCTFSIVVVFFGIFSGHSHWFFPGAIGGYLTVSAVIAFFLKKFTEALSVLIVVVFLFLVFNTSLASWNLISSLAYDKELPEKFRENSTYQLVFAGSYKWPETVKQIANKVSYKPNKDVFFGELYYYTAELAFYLPDHPRVYSQSNQYLVWGPPKNQPEKTIVISENPNFFGIGGREGVVTIAESFQPIYVFVDKRMDWEKIRSEWKLNLKGP
jgi:hypothetical protein